ncbi:GNAT family N-acetyltransferase [uncultured Dysgonomonas sp.]|uniref:GNAT family N-acetyltransferase n=1 Tax=uncultured Dysgonomonas sp. TaxID=206096 RepID=UPI002806298E|nr:GNAT family N-acetyltransferase [uncultured Dysgonomonas sp.]
MKEIKVKSLKDIHFDVIYEAFDQAFANYEVQINKVQLQTMLKRRGFDPELSFAAFDGDKIVAFTLNGIGDFKGIRTAYDTGTGTLKEYRGQGLATQVFEYSMPFLREAGIKQYLLEVLQHNTKAVSVYRNLGFAVTREFYYSMQTNEHISNLIKESDTLYSVKRISIDQLDSFTEFWDFTPSWQNSFESIQRAIDDFICLGVFVDGRILGYCVFEPISGDLTQIAVDKKYRRQGIASLLLKEILNLNKNSILKIVNTDVSCHSITDFIKAKNIEVKGKQFEMIRKI